MVIFFEKIEVDYVMFNPSTIEQVGDSTSIPTNPNATKAKFEKDIKLVRAHMLSYMANNLFDLFVKVKSAKSIWDILEKKINQHACINPDVTVVG
ncbi:hypothetical protein GOBAR_DD10723 [Gossypium barbadense]|nr:hypothetical protein GOBAR_DD10723 [Gossypium barbadense]